MLLAMVMPLAQGHAAEGEGGVTADSLRQEMQKLEQKLTDFNAERRDQLMTDIDQVLSDIDLRAATLENRLQENWGEADRLARVQAQTAQASLSREQARVMEWYERMQDSADYTWESMGEGFQDAFDQLSEAWSNAEQKVSQAIEEN
jgi:flagellar hook-basal body complex protein FliE